jgi:hypothetical protein
MNGQKRYVMARKRGFPDDPAPDWKERLMSIDGVQVTGATGDRAHFRATPQAIDRVAAEFSPHFTIEEVAGRTLQ